MANLSPQWAAMAKLVSQFYAKADSEPFREAVDWKTLGLFDYPQIIKHPMDLGTVKRKINEGKYKSLHEAGDDVRQIWKNCMTYNADGSDFYNLAESMAKKFEEKFQKLLAQNDVATSQEGGVLDEPTIEEKRAFAKSLYKIEKDDLGKVVLDLENKCPAALLKNSAEDEVEINVDEITAAVFKELVEFVNSCGGGGAGGRKKKKART